MKTVFDTSTRRDLIQRIELLDEHSTAAWGKMNLYQMLKHCIMFEEMVLGKKKYTQSFLGHIFGRIALNNFLKNDEPMAKNSPTVPEFKIKERNGNIAAEKTRWITLLNEYEYFSNSDFIHPFFGPMTEDQTGKFVYKHVDHHLKQFKA